MKRSQIASVTAAALASAGLLVTQAGPASAATTCTVDASNVWSNGYVLSVTIGNTGPSTIASWNVQLDYAEAPGITGSWNATVTSSGNTVSAANVGYNGSIGVGQSASFGIQGTHDGTFVAPTCSVAGGSTQPPPTTTTAPDSTTPAVTTPAVTTPAVTTPAVTTPPVTTTTAGSTTTPPSGPADLTVNTGTKYQTVDGFGAAEPIWGGSWSTSDTQTLVGMGNNQLGLSIVRTGLSPVQSEWSTTLSSLKTAKSYGSNVKILASPWTAPANFKTNNSRTGGGKLKTDYYDDYANHLNSYVQYMKGQGVTIDVTSVQNEPDWHPDYDSMDWSGTEIKNFVHDQGAKVTGTKLLVAESLGFNRSYTDPTLNDATARNNIGYVGGHLYGTEASGNLSPYPLAAQYGKNQWMTEWNLHAADGGGSNIWGDPSNAKVWNETLDDIMRTVHKSMESNWSAYIWWYGKRYYSFIGDGESQYGTANGAPLKRGYAFSQFAKYVRPGYQRVGLTKSSKASPLEVTAYQGSGKIVLVVLNRSTSAVNNAIVQAPQGVSKAEYYVTSQSQSAAAQSAGVNGGQVTVSVPARSISTVVLTL
jgi:glucuronoarabinoxylan endo-1,4-beta-xylanase